MTRVRRLNDRHDGAAIQLHNRPPAEIIPEQFQPLLAEYDRLLAESAHADNDLRELVDNWVTLRQEAIRADARDAATAARDGQPITATASVDALAKRLEDAQAKRQALKLACEQLPNELNDIRYAEQRRAEYAAKVAKGRADLHKATATVATKAQELARAIALQEWIHDQKPWDASIVFDALDVLPAARGRFPSENNPPTSDLRTLIAAIDNL